MITTSKRQAVVVLAAGLTLALAGLAAGPKANVEPKADQKAVADVFAKATLLNTVICDDAGNIIKLAVTNHSGILKEKPTTVPAGIDDGLFAKVLELKHLQAIALEKQPLSNKGYALLGQLKELRDVRLHYIGGGLKDVRGSETPPDRDAPLFINDLPLPLEVLEIKHCFSIKGGCMEKLKAQPELKKLEIDTGYATSDAVGFIKNAPKIENLQIHRTSMNDGDMQEIFAALPNLEILLIRPDQQKGKKDRITGKSLRGLANCPKLRLLILGIQWQEMPWEDGLEVLSKLPKLEKISFAVTDIEGFSVDHPSVMKLHEARPDIEINIGGKKLGGGEGRTTEQEDAKWNWDNGVTTHG